MVRRLLVVASLLFCNSSHAWFFNTDYPEPPPIVRTSPPSAEEMKSLKMGVKGANEQVIRYGLALHTPTIPDWSKNKTGKLIASWNPTTGNTKRPAIVMQHGGVGGPGASDHGHARWFKQQGYNVLVLDSFWSRGFIANWRKIDSTFHGPHYSALGANTRARDAFAAAKWLKEQPTVDPERIFLLGGSQGGWSVLRTFTDEKSITDEYKGLFRAGIALYPACWSWQLTPGNHGKNVPQMLNPRLGPFYAPVLLVTAGLEPPGSATDINSCDPNIIKAAAKHIRYEDQTHSFESETPPEKPMNRCSYSSNPHWCGASGGRDPVTGNCKGAPKADMCTDVDATAVFRNDAFNFLEQFK